MKRYSILQDLDERTCIVCDTTQDIHIHEVFFGTANRQLSIKYGLCVCLCAKHHNMSKSGAHFDKKLDNLLKSWAQSAAQNHYGWDTEQFIKIFGKNYL